MAEGPGKYDDEVTLVRERIGGSVVLIVFDGCKGEGFSVQANAVAILALPRVLRLIADQIERDRIARQL